LSFGGVTLQFSRREGAFERRYDGRSGGIRRIQLNRECRGPLTDRQTIAGCRAIRRCGIVRLTAERDWKGTGCSQAWPAVSTNGAVAMAGVGLSK
jgi:hypothetical protein